jgi:hypothetical protein
MLRVSEAVGTVFLTTCVLVCPGFAQEPSPGALGEMPVPGGLQAAVAAIDDPVAPDRSQFLLEVIRRVHGNHAVEAARAATLVPLLSHLDAQAGAGRAPPNAAAAAPPDTLPLPLPPAIWSEAVFRRAVDPHALLAAILRSRDASLLYYGLLWLDEPTRAWFAGQPSLVADITTRHAAAFVLAAPALSVQEGIVRVPGGLPAEAGWQALTAARVTEPAAFIRALLTIDAGRLAYFYGALGPLTPEQVAYALALERAGVSDRVAAARDLYAVFARVAKGWTIDERPFRRPPLDPALLVSDLRVDDGGRPVLPGTRAFWRAVFDRASPSRDERPALDGGDRASFAWLCGRIFTADHSGWLRRYHAVLFASRHAASFAAHDDRGDALTAVHAAAHLPALAAALERARLLDPAPLAQASRRAAQLTGIRGPASRARAITQFQGALALIVRASTRGSMDEARRTALVSSLAAVEPSRRGDYEGAIVRWLVAHVGWRDGDLDRDLLDALAAPSSGELRTVEWEGGRYALDLRHAEARRLERLLGDHPRPYAASAQALLALADGIDGSPAGRDLNDAASRFDAIAFSVGWDEGDGWGADVLARYRHASAAIARGGGDRRALARALRVLADDALARGLAAITYAVALGHSDRGWVSADQVARRHAFHGRPGISRVIGPWDPPFMSGGGMSGSLLGLDVAYGELWLVRLSDTPPPRRPTVAADTRRGLVEAIALVESARLRDEDRDAIAAAVRRGRAKVSALRTREEAAAIARALRLSGARAHLLAWVVEHDAGRLHAFLSTGELARLGLGEVGPDAALHAWGAPAGSRLGCLCLQLPAVASWEVYAGRHASGMLASAFPDLNLRLAELLADARMPSALLGPVLGPATLALVNTATSRGDDDRRGLHEYVAALGPEQLDDYLAPLTSGGPLVPLGEAWETSGQP